MTFTEFISYGDSWKDMSPGASSANYQSIWLLYTHAAFAV